MICRPICSRLPLALKLLHANARTAIVIEAVLVNRVVMNHGARNHGAVNSAPKVAATRAKNVQSAVAGMIAHAAAMTVRHQTAKKNAARIARINLAGTIHRAVVSGKGCPEIGRQPRTPNRLLSTLKTISFPRAKN
jgi:hypothetical protein